MGHGNGETSLLQNLAGSQKSNATDKIKATYRDNFSCLPEDISTKDVKKKTTNKTGRWLGGQEYLLPKHPRA